MITAITIENFKGIRDRARLDLRPITLVFGPNSGGKSSILQAIHYAHDVLERHNTDADRMPSGGESINLGGFANFVHGRSLAREIRLRFDLALDEAGLPHLSQPIDEATEFGAARFVTRVDQEARACWVELAIARDPASAKRQDDALPRHGRPLLLGLRLRDDDWTNRRGEKVEGDLREALQHVSVILTHILAAPVELLRRSLANLRHLGPLRQIPWRGFLSAPMTDAGREASGLGPAPLPMMSRFGMWDKRTGVRCR